MPFPAGDLEAVQGQAQSAVGASSSQLALTALTGLDMPSADTDRAHLEANMAAALTLQSPQEYERWLLTYAQYLTRSKRCPSLTAAETCTLQSRPPCCDRPLLPDLLSKAVPTQPL